VIATGSQAEDPERMTDFIDWLYSPEGIQIAAASPSLGTAGPEGLTWEMREDGPYLTEFGKKAFLDGDAEVPANWGGGTWVDGVSQLNLAPVSQSDLDPNGYPYYYTQWKSFLALENSALDMDWKAYMGADSSHQYLEDNNQIIVAPGCGFIQKEMSTEVTTIRELCRKIVVDYSWQMVFAPDEATFYSLMKNMQDEAKALGYEGVYAVDLQNAKDQDAARKAAVALSGN
jgi:multiple sugar transport system substrate-binding protein/putative aldouronate transport system substrate-binding protein